MVFDRSIFSYLDPRVSLVSPTIYERFGKKNVIVSNNNSFNRFLENARDVKLNLWKFREQVKMDQDKAF